MLLYCMSNMSCSLLCNYNILNEYVVCKRKWYCRAGKDPVPYSLACVISGQYFNKNDTNNNCSKQIFVEKWPKKQEFRVHFQWPPMEVNWPPILILPTFTLRNSSDEPP